MFGVGLQSIEPIDRIIVLGIRISFERKTACSGLYKNWLQNMANILCVVMVAVLGISKPVNS
jgi:hypothetical protein